MAGCGPSTSGRLLDGGRLAPQPFQRSCAAVRQQQAARRGVTRPRTVACSAIALHNRLQLPLFKLLLRVLRTPQEAPADAVLLDVSAVPRPPETEHSTPFGALLRQATYAAVNVGLKLTGLAIRLARTVVEDMRRSVRFLHVQQQVQKQATAARRALTEEALLQLELRRKTLRLQGKDTAFMQMLQTLDRGQMDHESKWASFQKHTADKADFSERLQHLFKAARESKESVETLLRPDASRTEINKFWKSSQTAELIAEEAALKQLVFAQMLQASTA